MTGAELIAKKISEQGINRIFTFPGGTIAPIFEACKQYNIDIVTARHEQGAGYAALAMARITRNPQVVMVTSGPGVTNLTTVLADAYFDSTPLVAITGQVGTADLFSGRHVRQLGFQQVDTITLVKSITKAAFLPRSPDELPGILQKAFYVASAGRQGPVVIDLPMDVQRGVLHEDIPTEPSNRRHPKDLDLKLIKEAASWLSTAEKPVIFAGQGILISGACEPLRRLVDKYQIPVAMSLLGLGAIPTISTLALGFPGHTGNQYAGSAIHESDLLLAVGVRLDVRQTGNMTNTFVPNGRIIHIDLDESELKYPRVKTDMIIESDAKTAIEQLSRALEHFPKRDVKPWLNRVQALKEEFPLSFENAEDLLKPQQVIEAVNQITKGRSVIVSSGVGSHQQWTARHFDFDYPNRTWLTSGGHGAMGYDLPTAIGAQLTRPGDLVICFVGDGSFQINIQELQMVVDYKTPVKIFVLDNSRLAMVSQFQLFNWETDPTTGNKTNPDFAAIGRAYGISSYTLRKVADLKPTIKEVLNQKGPALVHCIVDPKEDVSPMLLPGQTMDGMWPYV